MTRAIIAVGSGVSLLLIALVAVFWHIGARGHGSCGGTAAGPPKRQARATPGGGARALGLGGNRSCAALSDGSVRCWGDDQRDPDAVTRPLLTDALNQGRFHGPGYGCLLEHGAVTCWDGARDMAAPSEHDFLALWVGLESACGKRADGTVECWGTGHPFVRDDKELMAPTRYEGLRGVDDLVIRYDEIWVRFKQRVARIDLGHEIDALRDKPLPNHSLGPSDVKECNAVRCARTQTQEVVCWSTADHSLKTKGRFNVVVSVAVSNGQLCGKENTGAETCESCDTLLEAPPSDTATPESSCRVEPSGTVLCDDQFVVEGNGLVVYPWYWHAAVPSRRLAGVTDAVKVSGDASQICVLQKLAPWQCTPLWSEGRANKQRGEGDWQVAAAPTQVAEAAGAESVAVNRFALCFSNAQHTATCYRRGTEGTLRYRLDVPGVRKVVVGSAHACAIGEDDTLSCWGANESGQALGKPILADVAAPSRVLSGVVDVALGLRQTCAVTRDRGVLCFGENTHGLLGAKTADAQGMTPIAGSLGSKQVVIGFTNACALSAAGAVTCWGGLDEEQRPRLAHAVGGLGSAVLQLAAGGNHTCALLSNGRVSCWLGADSAPSQVQGAEDSTELALGEEHACVRNASGRVRCWGSNEYGQAGLDIRVDRTEVTPPHSCPQVSYKVQDEVTAAEDVMW